MAHTYYENFILEDRIEDMLNTKLDIQQYITTDYSLTEGPGDIKQVQIWNATGTVEDLAEGEGNSDGIEVTYETKTYEVTTTQGKFEYSDESARRNPLVVETGLQKLATELTNNLTDKAIAAMGTTQLTANVDWTFGSIADAIGAMKSESEEGLFMLINPAQRATLRKNLGEALQYSEGFVRTGYIGTVCGVPVYYSNAVPEGEGYIATKAAVTCYVKKGTEIEQVRLDANKRQNAVYARKVMLVALTDGSKCVKLISGENAGENAGGENA